MYVFIISILRFASLFKQSGIFRANKKTEVSDPPREACSATHLE